MRMSLCVLQTHSDILHLQPPHCSEDPILPTKKFANQIRSEQIILLSRRKREEREMLSGSMHTFSLNPKTVNRFSVETKMQTESMETGSVQLICQNAD